MRSMSSRLGIRSPVAGLSSHSLQEAVEEIQAVVGAWTRFRGVLGRRALSVPETRALHGAVVEVEEGQLGGAEVGVPADRLVGVDRLLAVGAENREAMVLA